MNFTTLIFWVLHSLKHWSFTVIQADNIVDFWCIGVMMIFWGAALVETLAFHFYSGR